MSEVRLIVRSARQSICGNIHASVADALIAALSAEPETIDDLQAVVVRFQRQLFGPCLSGFRPGEDDTPSDAGVVIIDLTARLVVCESTYSSPGPQGYLQYHDGDRATDHVVRYHLPDDWAFTSQVIGWQRIAQERRTSRAENPPIDTRGVLYDRALLDFVAAECWKAFSSTPLTLAHATPPVPADASASQTTDLDAAYADDPAYGVIRDIHVRWLLTPRVDLGSRSPRDCMHEKREFITWDLQDRCEQWSRLGEGPPPLDPQSHAFRFAGYGVHEMVVYYYLVRQMLWSCRDLCAEFRSSAKCDYITAGDFLSKFLPRLERVRDEWLDTPNSEYYGRTPQSIIDHERRRMPEVMSHSDLVIDDDCPLCAMAADMPGPTFWHLDGCNMDDDFAFSIFERTQEQWDEKQREYEEFNRRFNEREAERERLRVKYPRAGYADPDYVWQRSFVAPGSDETSLVMRLFSVGCSLSELICDLKEATKDEFSADLSEQRELIDALGRDFGNLREVVQSHDASLTGALIEPVLDCFCETLGAVAAVRGELEPKCTDLQQRLRRFLEPPTEVDDFPTGDGTDDLPW